MRLKRICKFEVIVEAVPMLTPIAIVWDKTDNKYTVGVMILCFVLGIRCERKGDDVL
tara:strand:+ start:4846 stop:5016 length:171 start_codon:yes stop_codon:yes gene_type:complete